MFEFIGRYAIESTEKLRKIIWKEIRFNHDRLQKQIDEVIKRLEYQERSTFREAVFKEMTAQSMLLQTQIDEIRILAKEKLNRMPSKHTLESLLEIKGCINIDEVVEEMKNDN